MDISRSAEAGVTNLTMVIGSPPVDHCGAGLGSRGVQHAVDARPEATIVLSRARKHSRGGDTGASVVEYGLLIAAIVALVVIVVFALLGLVRDVFDSDCRDSGGGSRGTSSDCR